MSSFQLSDKEGNTLKASADGYSVKEMAEVFLSMMDGDSHLPIRLIRQAYRPISMVVRRRRGTRSPKAAASNEQQSYEVE